MEVFIFLSLASLAFRDLFFDLMAVFGKKWAMIEKISFFSTKLNELKPESSQNRPKTYKFSINDYNKVILLALLLSGVVLAHCKCPDHVAD